MPITKKYLKYFWILLIGVLLIIGAILLFRWLRKDPKDGTTHLRKVTTEIGAKLGEANQQAAVETAAARTADQELNDKLEKTLTIEDDTARRAEMLDLYEEVQAS